MRDPLRLGRTIGDEIDRPVHIRARGTDATSDPVEESVALGRAIENAIRARVIGQDALVRGVLLALLSGGHCLVEGTPGLGKTMLVRTIGAVLGITFSRIQFTPDLMPTDIIGTSIYGPNLNGARTLRFEPGPLFAGVVLADEVNRATPKTQSALLEAMEEGHATVGGETYRLPEPFFVLATQNPIEMEGTYPLPDVQLDRFFFKLHVDYPSPADLNRILEATTRGTEAEPGTIASGDSLLLARAVVRELPIASYVREYAARLVLATHPNRRAPRIVRRYVSHGASPRGAQSMILAAKARALLEGRYNVSFADIRSVALPALRHRVKRNLAGEVGGITTDQVLDAVLREVVEE